jgi:transglutaminase-like putative cysteine protease
MSHIQIKTPSLIKLLAIRLSPQVGKSLVIPRRWESSKIKNFSEADKKQCSDPLRGAYSIKWIPAFVVMNKPLLYGLILSIFMVIAPHAEHLPLWVSSLCGVLLTWRVYLTHSGKPLPNRWLLMLVTFASVGGILLSFKTLFGREVGVTLVVLLAALKLMELRKSRDAMALIYLACFIIITNFFYSQSIPTALYMFATLMVILSSWIQLQAQHLAIKPRLRIAATLLLQAIPLMVILFVLFPRIQGPLWGLPQDAYANSGLDDKMSPGSFSRLSLSEEVAFRVTYKNKLPRRDQMYWRGPVLWHFDGRTWIRGTSGRNTTPKFTEVDQPIDYSVTLEPHNKPWLFALDVPNKISLPAGLTDDFQILNKEPVNARLRYEASSYLSYHANLNEVESQLNRALQLPQGFNPRALQLAKTWLAVAETAPPPQPSPDGRGSNRSLAGVDETIVRTALSYFNQEAFQYTLEPPLLGANNVDDFLFTSKQGFCEHYASAFVFLMRAAHIPARVVTGYQGGEFNDVGNYYIVRQSDAHAWAEVWRVGQGWVRVDPTAAIAPERVQRGLSAALPNNATLPFMARNPPQWMRDLRLNWDAMANQWNQWVIGYNSERQFAFLTRLGMEDVTWQQITVNLVTGLGIAIGLLALYLLRHLFARKTDKVQAAWLKLCDKLAKAGLPRSPHEGAIDYANRVAIARPELGHKIRDLAKRYSALRYGKTRNDYLENEYLQRATAFKI